MKSLLLICFILLITGCNTTSLIPTLTTPITLSQKPKNGGTPSATPMMENYPPCTPSQIDQLPTSTSLSPDSPPQKLTDGLTIEEYRSYMYQPRMQDGGCKYDNRKYDERTIDLNHSYQITIQSLDMDSELVKVSKADNEIFEAKTLTYGSSGLVQAWSYDNHWVIEIKTADGVDIFRDGQSQKKANKYDKVFAFQLLADKPFYFFKRGNVWGVNYDNRELQLNYDDIPYTNVSDGMDSSVVQYQNMVLFQANRGSENYSVVIGVFR